eukprot:TRINITY_DN11252_c1_g1_i1.p1 TRINITY_DN11252_c1_g1~~TRINITY_DN11252_c1_g1_i1.p1  ORF type:complete len:812 (+),score=71.68 TRINITY_DN11252_c1_g1_i1:228-2438(+)
MTTDEKLELFHGSCSGYTGTVCGNDRLGIPPMKAQDGPQGFRPDKNQGTSTQWPSGLTMAASFDDELVKQWGEAMGKEFYGKGANVQLGPGVCIARVPQNGRNFEYISGEDPYLGFRMAAAVVSGIQSQGVVANVKHWVNNNQETNRTEVTEIVDERTQHEIYYAPFEGAISANLGSAMCSYNKICVDCPAGTVGKWSCENPDTLQRDLKDRLGFKGWVMSDWGATHSTSINAGLDQEMPGNYWMGEKLKSLVRNGIVTEAKVNESAVRILWPLFQVGLFDKPNTYNWTNNVSNAEHDRLARVMSAASTVLLKNDNDLLPIGKHVKNIAMIGTEAVSPHTRGDGSGWVPPPYKVAPWASLRVRFGLRPTDFGPNNCSDAHWEKDTDIVGNDVGEAQAATVEACCAACASRDECVAFTLRYSRCFLKSGAAGGSHATGAVSGVCKQRVPGANCKNGVCVRYASGGNVSAAVELAAGADVVLVFVATTSSEGGDRKDLSLGDQDNLIQAVADVAGKKTVVVAVAPGAILTPWRKLVAAILTPLLPGQEYGNAIMDVLFGEVNPSAKLPLTFPNIENEMNFTKAQWPGENNIALYSERLQVGYRWYGANKVTPAFPFGHGLSYTTFAYMAIEATGRQVNVNIRNIGLASGCEVVQLYLEFPDSAKEPPKQLKGYSKVRLSPGEATIVNFLLDDRSFSIWDVTSHSWSVVPGDFKVMVGSSSEDIRVTAMVNSAAIGLFV